MFKNIDEAITWIISRRNNNYSFEHFKSVCEKLGNPQNKLRQIHVAGTNGKGSTVTFLASLLRSAGFKVGTFISPHYIKHQDRIRINNEYIPDEDFLIILNRNYDFFIENDLSMFEMDYLIMVEYFLQENVDYAVIEVGLGGRLDSTNVVDNTMLSIITTIGFDHMERLGNTLPLICREKCGIIKDNSNVLIGELDEECKDVVKEIAKDKNSKLYKIGEYIDLGNRRFKYMNEEYSLNSYAKYQIHNACLALSAFKIISDIDKFNIDNDKAKDYLSKSLWRCRYEIVKEKPCVILDGGHNIHGINALVKSFDELKGSKCIIFSALKRKEYQKMVDVLKKHCNELVITTFNNNEVIDLSEFENTNVDYKDAIDKAVKKYDNVLICGSLYFMSEVVLNYHF